MKSNRNKDSQGSSSTDCVSLLEMPELKMIEENRSDSLDTLKEVITTKDIQSICPDLTLKGYQVSILLYTGILQLIDDC